MKNILKTAGIQMSASPSLETNLSKAGSLIALAVSEGARIVCLPQLFNTIWFAHSIDKKNFSLAETSGGHTITAMQEEARKNRCVLIAPIFEEASGSFFNTAFVIGDDGEVIGRYRKMHVPQLPLWEERSYFSPGDLGFPVFQTPYAAIGVQLCWDVFFPEGFRILALKGAQIIFAPTASAFERSRGRWERGMQAAAHSNGVFVFRVNRTGKEDKQEFYGKSFCAGPDGEFIVKPGGSSDGVVIADVDLETMAAVRREWVFLRDRRPGEYKEISEKER
ncbi:MAG: acyltransferase [Deltaproteobacteria bacterium]|nr:acyltransferase [Deltaproteobacteria bacterium]